MQVVSAHVVLGTATPGVEVEFRGEGGDSVSIHLKDDGITSLSDPEVLLKAKQMVAQIIAFSGEPSSAAPV